MLEASTQPCPSCHGTGLIRSDDSVGLTILRQLEEEGVRRRSREVLVKAPVSIVNFLMNMKREHVAQIEARYGMAVRIEADPHLITPDFTIEKFKTATRRVEAVAPVVSVDASLMAEIDEDASLDEEEVTAEIAEEEDRPRKKRRRRRRRRGKGGDNQAEGAEDQSETADDETSPEAADEDGKSESESKSDEEAPVEVKAEEAAETAIETKPKRRRTRRKKAEDSESTSAVDESAEAKEAPSEVAEEKPADADVQPAEAEKPKRRRTTRKKKADADETTAQDAESADAKAVADTESQLAPEPVPEVVAEPDREVRLETVAEAAEPIATESAEVTEAKPRKRGWWSMSR